ncbi:hypothetical protein DAEQUDRAFT_729943 [Daedalea quercina L-15889]|uniref:Uncharacterized protein n=1 Tax=Daedalea quercina L-15889 TaxID=1314783 RepID=A0A165N8R1_9APHY|nr:hypothetical protein DAEQUDRAFT_729943 [Daedalea quercina L-15889]
MEGAWTAFLAESTLLIAPRRMRLESVVSGADEYRGRAASSVGNSTAATRRSAAPLRNSHSLLII